METLASMLQNAMGGAFPMVQTIANHVVPLHFETYGGSVHDDRIQDVGFGHDAGMEAHTQLAEDIRCPEVMQAARIALAAHAYLPGRREEARREAQKALRVSPICPEAHNVLALCSDSLEEALGHYRRTEEVGTQVCPPQRLQQELKNGDLWMRLWARPYLRWAGVLAPWGARFSVALRASGWLTGRAAHAPAMQGAVWHGQHAAQAGAVRGGPAEVRPALPAVLQDALHGPIHQLVCSPTGAVAARARPTGVPHTHVQGPQGAGQLHRVQQQPAVLDVRHGPGPVCLGPGAGVPACCDQPRGRRGGRGVGAGLGRQRRCCGRGDGAGSVECLLGESPMPSNPLPRYMGPSTTHTQAALYVHMCGDLWRATPGALDFIRRVRNTQQVALGLFKHAKSGEHLDVDFLLSRIEGGIFANVSVTPAAYYGATILSSVCTLSSSGRRGLERTQARLVHAVLQQGVDPQHRGAVGLTALCQAAYYAAGPEVVRLLLDAGFDPLDDATPPGAPPDDTFQNPLSMAANQGNPREMDAVLTHSPHLRSCLAKGFRPAMGRAIKAPVLELLLYAILESSCLSCVAGGMPCQRCDQGDGKHSPHCSFHGCIDVLVKHGLRSSPRIQEQCQALIGYAFPQNRRYVRNAIAHFEAASKAAEAGAAAAPVDGGSSGGRSRGSGQAAGAAVATASCSSAAACGSGGVGGGAAAKRCAECGTSQGKLLRCSGCKQLWFCSRECQVANWASHKAACRAAQRAAK
ncbi:hypothetical protein ABPG75_006836 [Micractinium tetrahymenae]